MTSKVFLAVIITMMAIFSVSCASVTTISETGRPPAGVPPAPNKYLVAISAEEFNQQAHISKSVAVNAGESFTSLVVPLFFS